MGTPTLRGKKIVTATYNATAVGVCLAWNYRFKNEYHAQPNEDSNFDDAQLLMHQSMTAGLEMIHGVPANSQTAQALSITERLGDGTTRVLPLGNHVTDEMGGSHAEGGVTSFNSSFINVGSVTAPAPS